MNKRYFPQTADGFFTRNGRWLDLNSDVSKYRRILSANGPMGPKALYSQQGKYLMGRILCAELSVTDVIMENNSHGLNF